jgi:Tol biopolymer transport system component
VHSTDSSSEPVYVGSKILFVSGALGNNGSIFEMNTDGSSVVNLTTTTSETFFNGSY